MEAKLTLFLTLWEKKWQILLKKYCLELVEGFGSGLINNDSNQDWKM